MRIYERMFIVLVLFLFGILSLLLIVSHQKYPVVSYSTKDAASLEPQIKKIIIESYEKDSSESIGVLITTDNLDSASKIIKSKGGSSNKHKVGKVITATIPQDQIDSLAEDDSITQILPNRPVKAFSVDVSETGAETFWNSGITGKGVKVAVLDTGIYSDNVVASADFTGEGINDDNGHGTKIAEIILAMAPDAELINAKVLDKNGLGSEASVIAGINYAVEQNADIISLSLGGLFDDLNSPLVSAVEDAVSKGITVVVASGNCGKAGMCGNFVGVATPGNAPNVITVGSVDGENAVDYSAGSEFENYIKPDVTASVSANDLSGTSASTPFVAGAAALLIDKYNAKPLQVKSLIEQNSKDLGAAGKDTVFGSGKLNLNFLNETPAEPIQQPIIFEPQQPRIEPTTNKNVQAFSYSTKVGDWNHYVIENDNWEDIVISDFYSNLGGFVRTEGFWIATFNGTKEELWAANWNPNGCTQFASKIQIKDIKTLGPAEIYIVSKNRVGKYDGTQYIAKETLPWAVSEPCGFQFNDVDFDLVTIDIHNDSTQFIGFAGGTNYTGKGIILKKSTATGSWSIDYDKIAPIKDIKFVNRTLAFAIGSKRTGIDVNQLIYKWNGVIWAKVANITAPGHQRGELNEMEVVANDLIYAVGNNGTMMKWDGIKWTNESVGLTTSNLYDISFFNRTAGYAVGSNATILKYINSSWYIQTQGNNLARGRCVDAEGNDIGQSIYLAPTLNDVHVFSSIEGYLFGTAKWQCPGGPIITLEDFVPFRLQPTAPQINVPDVDLEQGAVTNINLADYSDGTSFDTTYPANINVCSNTGNTLLINPTPSSFYGLKTCKITAIKDGLSSSETILVNVLPSAPMSDLMIEAKDILIVDTADPETLNVTVHNIGQSGPVSPNVKLIETNNNKIIQEWTVPGFNIGSGESDTIQIPRNINRGSRITAVVDYDNLIIESTEANNRAEITYGKQDVYLNVNTNQFVNEIKNYLTENLKDYNIIPSPSGNYIAINVNYSMGTKQKGCSLGNVYFGGKVDGNAHAGLIFTNIVNGKVNVNVCGSRIEGLLNALKRMNKNDLSQNKDMFFDKTDVTALSIRDFLARKTISAPLVKQALNGAIETKDKFVQTTDGTILRMKNYKPIVSQSFLDYLFNINIIDVGYLPPVIMAGGLWSDITAWDEAGREISIGMEDGMLRDSIKYLPRDVWLIELTGGPVTECDTCPDYTYEDVVNKHWATLVGGVMKLTGKNAVDYVGHSNGGRVALDALSNWNSLKGTNVGTLSDGSSIILPTNTNPIETYIGVGVPG
ncbi:S8 family serine peptidase, partial [Candidatus Woesearchaeota archaeon]|nr:S8 family serine peptidase [Candidatus Woesearchaeota archaeon]